MKAYISHPMPEEFLPTSDAYFTASAIDDNPALLPPCVDGNLYRGIASGITLELFAGFFFYGLWELYCLMR
jgi:hypothetical protein